MDADFTVVDLARRTRVSDELMASKSGWTPFAGEEAIGWPLATVVRGKVVMREGELFNAPAGELVTFTSLPET
jgi:dihydroorotase